MKDAKMNILDFYCFNGTDSFGRTVEDMIKMTDDQLEASHDVIQWLFPLHEESNYNPDCPILNKEQVDVLLNDHRCRHEAQKKMYKVVLRFMRFLGFDLQLPLINQTNLYGGIYVHDPVSEKNRKNWQTRGNHNHLRITRAIRSLRLFGLEEEAQRVFDAVSKSALEANCISENTMRYWTKALNGGLLESLR